MTRKPVEKLENREAMLDFIVDYWLTNKRSPSIREIQEGTGITTTSLVWYHLNFMEKSGDLFIDRAATERNIYPSCLTITVDVKRNDLFAQRYGVE